MEDDFRNLEEVKKVFIEYFGGRYPLDKFFILPQSDVNFRAYVFFKKNSDLNQYNNDRIIQEFEKFLLIELERFGRGKRDETTVAFELDSSENVEANFKGDYFLRMR